jgi:hypothetical protein
MIKELEGLAHSTKKNSCYPTKEAVYRPQTTSQDPKEQVFDSSGGEPLPTIKTLKGSLWIWSIDLCFLFLKVCEGADGSSCLCSRDQGRAASDQRDHCRNHAAKAEEIRRWSIPTVWNGKIEKSNWNYQAYRKAHILS